MSERSEAINELTTALSSAQGELKGATKDSTNPHFQAKYADLASCWDACREALTKHGIAVIQLPSADGNKVTVKTMLAHKSGQFISSDLTLTAVQGTPQGIGSAITYGRRYGLTSMVGIAPEDDDGNAASGAGSRQAAQEVAEKKIKAARKPPPPPSELESQLAATQKKLDSDKFKALEAFQEIKAAIIKETGDDSLYYRILSENGYLKSNEIPFPNMRPMYKKVAQALVDWRLEMQTGGD